MKILKDFKAFLFGNNKGQKQLIVKNTLWLTLAEALNQGLKLILVILAARILGATEYGVFTFALAFSGLFLFMADLGLNIIVTREFAKEEQKREVFWALVSIKIFLVILAILSLLLISFFVTKSFKLLKVIWVLGLMVGTHSLGELFFAYFRAKQQMEKEALVRISEALVVSILGFWVLFSLPSAFNLALAYLGAAIFAVSSLVIFFHLRVWPLRLYFDLSLTKKFLLMSWPLAFTEVFALIYNQIDSVMMGIFGFITEVGWYNAAYKVALGAVLPVMLISKVFFAPLASSFEESKQKFQKIWDYFLQVVFIIALPLTIGGIILAPKIIDFLYGSGFYPAVFALQILLVMTFFLYLNYSFNRLLIAVHKQTSIFEISLAGAGLNVILNFLLIPKYSLYGAALATVVTFIAMFALFILAIGTQIELRLFEKNTLKMFLGSILAVFGMASFLWSDLTKNWHLLLKVITGGLIYSLLLVIWQLLTQNKFSSKLKSQKR